MLGRALAIIAVCAVPCLLIFAVAPHLLLSVAFGTKRATASNSLLVLGAAFTVLAATYLAIQYMLALKRTWFLVPLGILALSEPFVLVAGPNRPAGFAATVLAVQALGVVIAFAIALRLGQRPGRRRARRTCGIARSKRRHRRSPGPGPTHARLETRQLAPPPRAVAGSTPARLSDRSMCGLLVTRCRLDVAADEDALQELLVLVVAERPVRSVAQPGPHRLGSLLGGLPGGQRTAGKLVGHAEVPQRLPYRLKLERDLAVAVVGTGQPELGVDDRALRGDRTTRTKIDPVALDPPIAHLEVKIGQMLGPEHAGKAQCVGIGRVDRQVGKPRV